MPRTQINFRLDNELHGRIKAECEADGVTITDFLTVAAMKALGMGTMEHTTHPSQGTLETLLARLADVEARLADSLAMRERLERVEEVVLGEATRLTGSSTGDSQAEDIARQEREALVAPLEELAEVRHRLVDLEADRDIYQQSAQGLASVAERNQELLDSATEELALVRVQLADCQMDCKRFVVEQARKESDMKRADTIISELRYQLADLNNACAIASEDANRWNLLAVERLSLIEQLQLQSQPPAVDPIAVAYLEAALTLKANSGGAIKEQVRRALLLLTASTDS